MGDMMDFPSTWELFLHDYEFEDAKQIYTNGSRLIPSFRVEQMIEHYFLNPPTTFNKCPCDDCQIGWGQMTAEGSISCEETCERYQKWRSGK